MRAKFKFIYSIYKTQYLFISAKIFLHGFSLRLPPLLIFLSSKLLPQQPPPQGFYLFLSSPVLPLPFDRSTGYWLVAFPTSILNFPDLCSTPSLAEIDQIGLLHTPAYVTSDDEMAEPCWYRIRYWGTICIAHSSLTFLVFRAFKKCRFSQMQLVPSTELRCLVFQR